MEDAAPLYVPDYCKSLALAGHLYGKEGHDALTTLLVEAPWQTSTGSRDECFMTSEPSAYTYGVGPGQRTYWSRPYHPLVDEVLGMLSVLPYGHRYRLPNGEDVGHAVNVARFNACFLNKYLDEGQFLGWHSDDSPGTDLDHPIAVVSFGQPREIWWRRIGDKGVVPQAQRQLLVDGSLFVMPAGFQCTHQHRIPKGSARGMGVRVSLTFRRYDWPGAGIRPAGG